MNRFIILLLIAFGFSSSVNAQAPETSQLDEIVVIGDPNAIPATWFVSDAKLAKIRSSPLVKYHVLNPNEKLYKERYASIISGQPPMILMQRASGGVMYAASAYTMPHSPTALYEALRTAWNAANQAIKPTQNIEQSCPDCPGGQCPLPTQQPPALLPRIRDHPQPFNIDIANPIEGWFSSTISTTMLVIGGVIVLGLMMLFGILALGLIYLIGKFTR